MQAANHYNLNSNLADNPIIVTQSATSAVTDFTSLSYKQISAFKTYPALSTNGTYTFQVQDAGTNAVLATYALATPRRRLREELACRLR